MKDFLALHQPKVAELDRLTRRKRSTRGRTAKPFNPLARDELQLFHALMDGADNLRGFTNRDLRTRLEREDGDVRRAETTF